MIHQGDCVEVMAAMDAESIDAIVTDPPYGLEFMGKEWDRLGITQASPTPKPGNLGGFATGDKPSFARVEKYLPQMQQWHETWATEALRVAKPGAYLLAFGGTRTVHRLTVALEDAGWLIRDVLVWVYAQGFPKSKSSLKPAWEPIVLARKPGPLAKLRIDECRIGTDKMGGYDVKPGGMTSAVRQRESGYRPKWQREDRPFRATEAAGRWPANVILTDPIFDGGWEGVEGGGEGRSSGIYQRQHVGSLDGAASIPIDGGHTQYGDTGTYSRFFLIPKASRRDREPDVPGELEERVVNITEGHGLGPVNTSKGGDGIRENKARQNTHPTVKPTRLMRHLIRLVTPEGGTVLDPFLGSGTTAKAAVLEGVEWVGIEREPEYVRIAEQRLVGLEPEPMQLEMTG